MARHSRLVDAALTGVDEVAQLDQALALAQDEIAALRHELEQTKNQVVVAQRARADADARREAVWSATPIGMGLVNELDEFVAVNEALCRLLGRSEQEILGSTSAPFVHSDDLAALRLPSPTRRRGDLAESRVERRYVRPGGEVRWAHVTSSHVAGPAGQPWALVFLDDVTERRTERQTLQDSEANLAALASVTRRIQSGEDARSTILAAVEAMTGAETASLVEPLDDDSWVITTSTASTLDGTTIPRGRDGAIAQAFRGGSSLFLADPIGSRAVAPAEFSDRIGSILWQPVRQRDRTVAVIMVKWAFRIDDLPAWTTDAVHLLADEMSVALAQEAMRAELRLLARTDPLTGLPNRRAWDDQLAILGEIAAVTGEPLIVAMVDLDHFKRFNDRFGHTAGDTHLREFASRARSALRDCDLLTRWGGEEFAVALPRCRAVHADAILRKVQHAVPGDQTCSIGWSTWDGRQPLDELMLRVDQSLYEAKAAGRGRIMSTDREPIAPT